MREHRLNYSEAVRKFWGVDSKTEISLSRQRVRQWKRIYLEERAADFMVERCGLKSKGIPRKKPLDNKIENDLIAENQRLKERLEYLEMENEYLKNRCLNSSGRAKEKAIIVFELRHRFPLYKLLALSELSRSTYYYHCKEKQDKYIKAKQEILRIYTENKCRYSYEKLLKIYCVL